MARGEEGAIDAGNRAEKREPVGGDRAEPGPDLAQPGVVESRSHRPGRPEQLVDARDRRVRAVAGVLVGRADRHPATIPGNQIPVVEARHDWPAAGLGVRFHVDDLPADRLDRHVEAELAGEAGGPRPAGDDDGVGREPTLVGLDARHGPALDSEPLDGRVADPKASAATCGPERRLELAAVHARTALVVQRALRRRQRRKALDSRLRVKTPDRPVRGVVHRCLAFAQSPLGRFEGRDRLLVHRDGQQPTLCVASLLDARFPEFVSEFGVVLDGRCGEPEPVIGGVAAAGRRREDPRSGVGRPPLVLAVDEHRLVAVPCEVVGDRRADDTTADHDCVRVGHASPLSLVAC